MARAARDTFRQAARTGLLATLATGCAQVQQPPGGPPDFTPPSLISVRPDSGAVLDGFDDAAEFQFDEVVTEPTGRAAERLFVLSPRPQELNISWKRSRLTVKPKEGWRTGVVYRLALLPQVTDLRNNRIDSGRVIIFALGRPIPDTRITGTVVDWEAGRIARGALVEAVSPQDSTVYFTQADSVGNFDLPAVPEGAYTLIGTIDQNNNQMRDRGEPFDSATVTLDSALSRVFWAFRQDTVGPQIRNTQRADSLTILVEFTQSIAPGPVDRAALGVFALPDTVPVGISDVLLPAVYDSLRAAERQRARAAADSARAAADTAAVTDTIPALIPDTVPTRPDTLAVAQDTTATPTDSAAAAATQLLAQRPPLTDRLFVRLQAPLTPGGRFLVTATVSNIQGYVAESRGVLAVPGGDREQ